MRATAYCGPAMALICLVGLSSFAEAADPVAAPTTLWNFLGIPQGVQKLQDGLVNAKGNFPKLERKPALKRIADPANLEADQPEVIKKAAQIKVAEDLAPQKIKAIKYLATIGCGCYEEVDAALLDALNDCTEAVRYEAAKALSEAAGKPCTACGGTGCCNAKTMTKLYELAYAQDESCCYVESSERVREAARKALQACNRVVPPSQPTPGPEGVPTLPEGLREEGLAPPPGPAPAPLLDDGFPSPVPAVPSAGNSPGLVNPVSLTQMAPVDVSDSGLHVPRYTYGPPAPGHQRQSGRVPAAVATAPQAAESESWIELLLVHDE